MQDSIKLTSFSKGAGCGCKIAPNVLQQIVQTSLPEFFQHNLLVGNNTNDDASVIDLGNGTAIISTTDFFMPIVDDANDFGKIAAANSISDVYAMGGKPITAIAILGWPIEKIPIELAQQVLDGARKICNEAGIALSGGHSIDSAEPIFGLAVTGSINIANIKQNNTAQEGDYFFLTKPIGVGILSTAQKRGVIKDEHVDLMIKQMTQLNSLGEKLGGIQGITAMTDITGFGLLGHLIEMAEGSGVSAELYYSHIPVIDGAKEYLTQRLVPDATYRNWNSYSKKTNFEKGVNVMEAFNLLPDPQTNGGLLISVKETSLHEVKDILKQNGLSDFIKPIGRFVQKKEITIEVKN